MSLGIRTSCTCGDTGRPGVSVRHRDRETRVWSGRVHWVWVTRPFSGPPEGPMGVGCGTRVLFLRPSGAGLPTFGFSPGRLDWYRVVPGVGRGTVRGVVTLRSTPVCPYTGPVSGGSIPTVGRRMRRETGHPSVVVLTVVMVPVSGPPHPRPRSWCRSWLVVLGPRSWYLSFDGWS